MSKKSQESQESFRWILNLLAPNFSHGIRPDYPKDHLQYTVTTVQVVEAVHNNNERWGGRSLCSMRTMTKCPKDVLVHSGLLLPTPWGWSKTLCFSQLPIKRRFSASTSWSHWLSGGFRRLQFTRWLVYLCILEPHGRNVQSGRIWRYSEREGAEEICVH